jgi:hypothetical protein
MHPLCFATAQEPKTAEHAPPVGKGGASKDA